MIIIFLTLQGFTKLAKCFGITPRFLDTSIPSQCSLSTKIKSATTSIQAWNARWFFFRVEIEKPWKTIKHDQKSEVINPCPPHWDETDAAGRSFFVSSVPLLGRLELSFSRIAANGSRVGLAPSLCRGEAKRLGCEIWKPWDVNRDKSGILMGC